MPHCINQFKKSLITVLLVSVSCSLNAKLEAENIGASGYALADSIKDSTSQQGDLLPIDTLSAQEQELDEGYSLGQSIFRKAVTTSIPMVFMAIPYAQTNKYIRDARNDLYPTFKYKYDDYLQFAPLALQGGLKAFGLKGYSQNGGQMLLSDALGTSMMLATVYGLKSITTVRRPDSSADNSFPSGHTAMAFTSATLLSLEYGDRYPWISLLGYSSATSVGVGRILNNRHWVGDVVVGATIGIVSAELGYWLSDLVFKRPKRRMQENLYLENTDLRITLPWTRGISSQRGFEDVAMGMGLRWGYSKKGYLIFAEAQLEGRRFDKNTPEETFLRNYVSRLGWGKKIRLIPNRCSVDATLGVGLTRKEIFPFVRLSPRIKLSRRLSWRIDASYELRLRDYEVYRPTVGSFLYSAPNLRLGSAFEIRL